MSDTGEALLRAICENPADDTPRLAFADWLEESGQPERAAFIRTDIAMSQRAEWDIERLRWEEGLTAERLVELTFETGLFPALPDGLRWTGRPITRRGFPGAIGVENLGRFRDRAVELFARHPIEHLAFRAHLPQLNRFVSEPWFPRIRGLEWAAGFYSSQSLRPLLEAPNSGLTELAAHAMALTPDGLRAVGESGLVERLARVFLTGGPQHGQAFLRVLSGARPASRLRSLTLRAGSLNRDALPLACSLPESLRLLDVRGTQINSDGAREFAGAKTVAGLRMLNLSSNHVGNAGATAIFTSPHLAGLKVLDLSYCQVGDEALRALLDDSPLADGLNLLNLTGSPASAEMKQAVKDLMGDRVRV